MASSQHSSCCWAIGMAFILLHRLVPPSSNKSLPPLSRSGPTPTDTPSNARVS